MKLTKSASGILSARYRIVLIKCFLANLILLPLPAAAITISSGTYGSEDFRKYNEDVIIEGGIFNNAHIDAPHITVTGGTFNGRADLVASDTLTITGGIFNIPDSIWLDAPNISIDSDKVYLSVKWSKSPESLYPSEYPEIDANVLTISGSRGIFVEDTQVNTLSVSGKITAKGSSFLGNIADTGIDIYEINGKTLYGHDYYDEKKGSLFSNSIISLNGNSVAGSGYYSLAGGIDANGNWDDDIIEDVVMLRNKLTNAEINESVSIIMADLKRAKSRDDLMDVTQSILGDVVDFSSLDWNTLDFTQIEADLRQKYADFNTRLGETGAAVNISASTFVLNDNAKLINDSFKSGDMTVTSSTVTANGNNELSARSGNVIFQNSTLKVAENAVLTFSSAGGALLLDSGSTLDLAGKMKGDVASDGATVAFQSSNARLDGTLSGSANAVFNADYALSNLNRSNNFEFRNITIMNGKTLDIGTTALKAGKISGGTISAILTDAAKTTPIITADAAENVTIKLNMSAASSAQTTLYRITNETTGFKLGDYSTSRYAVSSRPFDAADASKVGVLSNWSGGDLYILRLGGSTAPIIDDLENNGGIKVHPVIEKASQILDLDDKSLDSLTEEQLDALDKIDDLLAKFDRNPEKKYQILREVSPDLSKSALHSAESNTRNLLNVVGLRFSAPAAVQRRGYNGGYYNRYYGYYGRSGGDYTVGEGSVWAQGMINRVKSTAEQPFSATSGGFAAGIEVNASEAFKFGFGYAYTDTNIKSDRSKNNAETHSGFVYGHLQPQRAYFNFIAAFAHSKYKDTTSLARLESDYDTNSVSAQIAFGYTALLTPEIGLRYTNIHQSAFEDALGAKSQAKNVNAVTGTSGLKLSRRYRLRANPQVAFVPELKAAAAYDFERSNNDIAVLLPNGATYTVDGEKTKRFGVETGAGLTVYFGKDAVASLSYDGKFKKDYQDHTGMVNLKIKF